MSDFVIRLPLAPSGTVPDPAASDAGPGTDLPMPTGASDTSVRLSRMTAQNWHLPAPGSAIQTALRGDAAQADAGSATMIGLAILSNRAELRERLGDPDADLRDLDLLARLYQQEGPEFTRLVSGAFSVVLLEAGSTHDSGTRGGQAGTAYRDHFGILPFAYCVHDDHLTCGTDPRAILHLSGLPLVKDTTRIADFIMGTEVDNTRTAFCGLSRLPAAHLLDWGSGTPEIRRHWRLTLSETMESEAAVAGFRTHLQTATEACVHPPEGVGAMLSGGLDSSSLAGLAARALEIEGQPPLPTLSFTYGDKPYDESRYIEAANAAFRTHPHLIAITEAPRLTEMPEIVQEQMDLFLGYGMQKSRGIYHAARDLGLTALIDGHGGDEVVSHGYGRLAELAAAHRWLRLFIELRGAARVHGTPLWETYLTGIAQHSGLPQGHPVRRMLMRISRRLAPKSARTELTLAPADLLSSDLRATLDPKTRYAPPPPPRTRDECLRAETRSHLAKVEGPVLEHAFEVMHRMASAAGITPRYPFFERRLVEFCVSMPSDVKLRDGATRWVLRKAMTGILPERIRTRTTKAEFTAEFQEAIRIYLQQAGDGPSFAGTEEFVDPEAARRLDRHIRETPAGDSRASRMWWRLLVLRDWLQAFDRWQDQQNSGELL